MKKIWKRITAVIMSYTLIMGIVGTDIALAAEKEENIAVKSLSEKMDIKSNKKNNITENIKPKTKASEFDRILEECEKIKYDDSSKEIRKGQMMSVENVSVSGYTHIAIMSNGDLYCWGNNENGQVGNGTTENQNTPVKILSDVKSVLSSYFSIAAITENGDLYCWGDNTYGQVGNGTTKSQTIPIKVLGNVKTVFNAATPSFTSMAAITENGDLYCWGDNCLGYNESGQIVNGNIMGSTPVKILSDVKSFSYHPYHPLRGTHYCFASAITENGDLYCWGDNRYGQIGNGTTEYQITPAKVLSDVKFFSSTFFSESAITENGDLYCWGDNEYGQVGNGTTKNQTIPIKVLDNVKTVYNTNSSSYNSIAAITENGDLYCWGNNKYGQIGNGTIENQTTPVKVLGDVKCVCVSGVSSTAVITENGDLYCWGNNTYGQVGNGTIENQTTPVKVLGGVKCVYVSNFSSSKAAITENGDLYCWGDNKYGQVGNGTTENQTTPVKVLGGVKCVYVSDFSSSKAAITENGDLYCWGDNKYGQVGNGTTENQTIPIKVLSNVSSISISSYQSVKAITENGDLYCWGDNEYGEVGNGTTKNQLTPVKVLFDTSLNKSIAVFTTNKSMKIKTGKSISLGFGLLDKNSGLVDDKWKKMSVVVSDPTVIGLSDYTEMEYGYSIEITGKKQGATNITITDTETGINTIITISVQDDYVDTYSYAIDNIASFYPNNNFEKDIETNIYNLNGLYVNNYKCTKSTDSYNVSFDVYNSKYYSGAVDIYDENGMWLGYREIEKYSDISSLWNTAEQTWYLVSDTVTGKMLTYEQASYSKHTHIDDIEVPEGGYFTISNNISESPGTFFINAFEILFNGVSTISDSWTDGIEDSALTKLKKEANKTFATRLIEARNEGLKDNIKRTSQKVMLDSMKSKIKEIIKENIKTGLKDKLKSTNIMCSSIANLTEDMLAPKSFNIEWKPMFESATGIGESFFTEFAGPAGIALEGCFALNNYSNMILMATQMAESAENPYVTVFSSIDTGYINPYGIIVNTNGNIDAESVLQVFRISNDDVIEVLLNSDNSLENYELYNICFVKDDKLVQPNGKVTVQIPVPKGMKGGTCKVYRQETDGAWTVIDAKVQGNYLIFETDHFSFYAVIGENDNLAISSLPEKISYKNGEILDTYGLVLDLNGELITGGYICEPTVLSGNGKQVVKVIYGHSVTKFEVNVEETETPAVTPTVVPTQKPTGGSSGGYIPGPAVTDPVIVPSPVPTPLPSQMPSPSPTVVPVITITPVPVQTPLTTSTPGIIPTPSVMPEPSQTPEATLTPSVSPVVEENNNTSSSARLKKGSKMADKKTKAVYKIISTGKNKTAEYAKSIKKNTTNIAIPDSVKLRGKTFKVVSVGNGAFKNNKKLKSANIGKNVRSIAKEAFSGCKKLVKVKIGKNVNSIGAKAFSNCTSLTIITIPSKVKKIGKKAFYKCKNLRYIDVKTKKLKPESIGSNAFGNGYGSPRIKTDKSVWKQYQNVLTSKGLSHKAVFITNPVKLVLKKNKN